MGSCFIDICRNGYPVEITTKGNIGYLYITTTTSGKKSIIENLPTFSFSLYYMNIRIIGKHAIANQKFTDPNSFVIWHNQLGHPGSTIRPKTRIHISIHEKQEDSST